MAQDSRIIYPPASEGGGGGVAAIGYVVGDRRVKVTGTTNIPSFGAYVFTNILGPGSLQWAPLATINPLTSASEMEFAFSEPINLQYFDFQIGLAHQWGEWTVAIKHGAIYTDMASTQTLGGSQNSGFSIDAALQANAEGIRFIGFGGLISGSPFVLNARFPSTEV